MLPSRRLASEPDVQGLFELFEFQLEGLNLGRHVQAALNVFKPVGNHHGQFFLGGVDPLDDALFGGVQSFGKDLLEAIFG